MQVSLICGGPSPERGISLNSARSLLDHLTSEDTEVVPFYLDQKKRAYRISTAQLYSNTPSDFDFKLSETGKPLSTKAFVRALKETDLVFPVSTEEEALGRDKHLFSKRADTRVVVEQFAEGKEFTVIILQNRFGLPVAHPPTEMEMVYSEP